MAARRRRAHTLLLLSTLTLATACTAARAPAAGTGDAEQRLQASMDRLVDRPQGPPGALAVIQTGAGRRVLRSGVADVESGARPQADLHMRVASTAKAYSGGVTLSLVDDGLLSLDDTVGERLPRAPGSWRRVTLRQVLAHTSGLPDFSADPDFLEHLVANPREPLPPRRLLGFVADEPPAFEPGSDYRYSNSDNVVSALMAQAATGRPYTDLLEARVLRPLGLDATTLPRGVRMPRPLMHGYDRGPDGVPEDVSELIAAGYAWASGGVVSTPADQARFIRGYVGRDLFGADTQRAQFDWHPGGRSEPPGPGANAAGLALFRYRTGCGTAYGHTGNTPGYTQFFAASADGRRSVVVSVNRQTTPEAAPRVYRHLRTVMRLAVCAAFAGPR
jgi:D-alanyl-D-alanine carboxypeptidase